MGWVWSVALGMAAVTLASVETMPAFADFSRAAAAECSLEAPCLDARAIAEMDKVLLPLQDADPEAFHALTAEQARWVRYVQDVCWLAEEAPRVNLDARTRSDATARGVAGITCDGQAAIGRGFYARARRAGGHRAFAARIAAQGRAGTKARRYLRHVRTALAGKAGRNRAAPGARPLVGIEVEELLHKARAIEYAAGQLARATCRGWPALAEALGGAEPCVTQTQPYYLAYGPLEE